jgi:hypothetical protein
MQYSGYACWIGALALLAGWQPAVAQDQNERDRSVAVAASLQAAQQSPMTVAQKFHYHLRHSFDAVEALRAVGGAAFDEARVHPGGWGTGWDSYGARVASHFGQHLIKEQIEFGIQAADHESPLHLRSKRKGIKNRAVDAVVNTFVCANDNGKLMPAYSRFAADYGAAFISRTWYPREYHTVAAGMWAGTVAIGVDVGMNFLREFGPDIKKVFHRP